MSLHGLTRRLAGVERWWFAITFAGLDLPMRWLMRRMIVEYAQHDGHADLTCEGIDGAVGA